MTSARIITNLNSNEIVNLLTILGVQATLGIGWIAIGSTSLSFSLSNDKVTHQYQSMSSKSPTEHLADVQNIAEQLAMVAPEECPISVKFPEQDLVIIPYNPIVLSTEQILIKNLLVGGL